MKRFTCILAVLIAVLCAASAHAQSRAVRVDVFDVVDDSSGSIVWRIGDSIGTVCPTVDTFPASANGKVDTTWHRTFDSDSSVAQCVNETAVNDLDWWYYVNGPAAYYNSVKFDLDTTARAFANGGSRIDSVCVLYRTGTTAAAAKTLQCRWDSTDTGTGNIFDTVTADADSAYSTDKSAPITALTKRLLTKLTAGTYGIVAAGADKEVRVTHMSLIVYGDTIVPIKQDFDTSGVYDSRYWNSLTLQIKGHAQVAAGGVGGGADSGAATIVLQMSNDMEYWTPIDSAVAPDSLVYFKNITLQPYPWARFVVHHGTKTDSSGVRVKARAVARGFK